MVSFSQLCVCLVVVACVAFASCAEARSAATFGKALRAHAAVSSRFESRSGTSTRAGHPIIEALKILKVVADVALKIKKDMGCRSPPMVKDLEGQDPVMLFQVFSKLYNDNYRECDYKQRTDFFRVYGASWLKITSSLKSQQEGLKIEMPAISPLECQALLTSILGGAEDCNTVVCDEVWNAWVYYLQACKSSPDYNLKCGGTPWQCFSGYCIPGGSSSAGGLPSCNCRTECNKLQTSKYSILRWVGCNDWCRM